MTRSNRRKKTQKNVTVPEDVTSSDWFYTNALESGEVLRKFHAKADHRRCDFAWYLAEFLDNGLLEDELDALYVGGIPQALIDIAADRRLYEAYSSDYETKVGGA